MLHKSYIQNMNGIHTANYSSSENSIHIHSVNFTDEFWTCFQHTETDFSICNVDIIDHQFFYVVCIVFGVI